MRRYAPYVFIILMVLVFFWKLGFTNLILARGDTLVYVYPHWQYRAEMLLAGKIPLWNPYLFMGAPFLANPQTAVLYPLNWPLAFLPVHIAIKPAILIHIIIAGFGTIALSKNALNLSPAASTLAALLFALGGHLATKVEQINQLQALAWLPWLLLVSGQFVVCIQSRRRLGLIFSALFALQLLAGHTQTSFISITGVLIWTILTKPPSGSYVAAKSHSHLRHFWMAVKQNVMPFTPYIALGLLIISAQLLPTLELARHSMRGGGLPFEEAVSFSLHPMLLGRALLPSYGNALSNEYVGYIGVLGLIMALIGVTRHARKRTIRIIVLACTGLFFAFGGYNPLYEALAKFVPPFNLFRAPARWLALWAMGISLLAGLGLDALNQQLASHRRHRLCWQASAMISGLIALTFIARELTPAGDTGRIGIPIWQDLAGWLLGLVLGAVIILTIRNRLYGIVLVAAIEILVSSLSLPVNQLDTPQAYTSVRPAMTQLLESKQDIKPNYRLVSMSNLLFDPGDLDELQRSSPSPTDLYSASPRVVAAKAKEVLTPNLPLAWKLPSVDGYGGGILPLSTYAQFATGFTGSDHPSPDGRIREHLQHTPPNWLLNITNTRWLITDKLNDMWSNHVYYDLQFDVQLGKGMSTQVRQLRPLQATSVGLVLSSNPSSSDIIADLHMTLDDGSQVTRPIPSPDSKRSLVKIQLGTPMTPHAITISSRHESLTVHGLTLIDERSGAFQSQTLGPYRIAHSGDVKVYDNLGVFPRAYQVDSLPITPETIVTGRTHIRNYTPTYVEIETHASAPTILVLADALYPGWRASINNQTAQIHSANTVFRAIHLPPGQHLVTFHYDPSSWFWGVRISAVALLIWIATTVLSLYGTPTNDLRDTIPTTRQRCNPRGTHPELFRS